MKWYSQAWAEEQKGAVSPLHPVERVIDLLYHADAISKEFKHFGLSSFDYEDLREWYGLLDFLISFFDEDLKPQNKAEAQALEVFKKWAWSKKAPEEFTAYYISARAQFKQGMKILVENKREAEQLAHNYRREGYTVSIKPILNPIVAIKITEALIRTARRVGMYGPIKIKRPKVLLEPPHEITPPKLTAEATLPLTEIANNVLYSLVEYAKVKDVRAKMTWLRTALVFLGGYTFDEEKEAKIATLLTRLERVQRSVNWDVYEVARTGQFELITDEEYQKIAEKLAELERIRDETINLLLSLGISKLDMATIGALQKN